MAKKPKAPEASLPEPAVMAGGASLENAEQGKGSPPADPPKEEDKPADKPDAAAEEEGSRDISGRFTGNPPSDSERLDAICDVLARNGMSLPKVLRRPKE